MRASGRTLSARELNRATLARQLLLARADLDVPTAVRRVFALQAQHPPNVHLGLWSRLADLDLAAVDEALVAQDVVRASLLRLTLHVVSVDDHATVRTAMQPSLRASRVNDRRFRATSMVPADTDELQDELLALAARPVGRADVEAWLAGRVADEDVPWAFWALRTYAPWVTAPLAGRPWSFHPTPRYVAPLATLSSRLVEEGSDEHLDAVAAVVRRVLAALGPATRGDVASFTMLRQRVLRPALARLDGELVTHRGPSGETLLDVPDGVLPDGDTPAPPRLLPMWDSALAASEDRARTLPPAHRPHVVRRNGDVLPTLLVDGTVAGVWRVTGGGVELHALEPVDDGAWTVLVEEARGLLAALGGRPRPFHARHDRWFDDLPADRTVVVAP